MPHAAPLSGPAGQPGFRPDRPGVYFPCTKSHGTQKGTSPPEWAFFGFHVSCYGGSVPLVTPFFEGWFLRDFPKEVGPSPYTLGSPGSCRSMASGSRPATPPNHWRLRVPLRKPLQRCVLSMRLIFQFHFFSTRVPFKTGSALFPEKVRISGKNGEGSPRYLEVRPSSSVVARRK